jgi:hypothetical protein
MRTHARNQLGTNVEQIPLPDATLAVWLRIGSADRIAVSPCVPAGALAGVLRHLQSHATDALAEAIGLVSCVESECTTAVSWLHPPVSLSSAV